MNLEQLGIFASQIKSKETLAKNAGAILYYDAIKDTIIGNGITDDLSENNNDIQWINFSGDSSSGLITNDGLPYRRFDGSDDYGNIVKSVSLDVKGAPLAIFATMRVPVGAAYSRIFTVNQTSTGDIQYGLTYDNANKRVRLALENAHRSQTLNNEIIETEWVNVGFLWDGLTITAFINGAENYNNNFADTALTSRDYVSFGRRMTGEYYQGDIANLLICAGEKCNRTNVIKAVRKIAKPYVTIEYDTVAVVGMSKVGEGVIS